MTTAVHVDTTDYRRSHQKQPRGFGRWVFFVVDGSSGEHVSEIWSPHSMSYRDAKQFAIDEVKANWNEELKTGMLELSVGP